MNISFSTISQHEAKKYLEHKAFDYIPAAAKDIALKHVGEGKLRVQDPLMYSKPCLEIATQEIYDEVMGAMNE